MSFFKKNKRISRTRKKNQTSNLNRTQEDKKEVLIGSNMEETISDVKQIFKEDKDFMERRLLINGKTPAVLLFLTTLVDGDKVAREIIKPLQQASISNDTSIPIELYLTNNILPDTNTTIIKDQATLVDGILRGKTVLLVNGMEVALGMATYKPEKRSIEQPEAERAVRGPRDGFIEQIHSNIALLRNRLPVSEFRIKALEIGEKTKTAVSVCYLENIANEDLVAEVTKRIEDIKLDRILDSGYVEELIQDNPRSPFPQIQVTERPDKAVGNILEGRVIVLVDGSPIALIAPATFNMFYHASEDYNQNPIISSAIRIIRYLALVFSLTISSLYLTVLSFHPEMIPTQFLVAASSGRAGVPFPVVIEVILMEIAMEILREATIRMPQQVGGALSIVGVLVIGEAAVSAGFVSPITVVIIALATIGSFVTPSYNATVTFRC
ncbi:spore germination protein KA [Gracilibacillus halotolerans]|uniref:Spore germination protein KA n=1 Tax=Gracilibacillus halotolerans TaxID=74386 RepID=A0A841RPF6_9BACI|nr:spore germination protein KA [Gracilibacillus halotolerans]